MPAFITRRSSGDSLWRCQFRSQADSQTTKNGIFNDEQALRSRKTGYIRLPEKTVVEENREDRNPPNRI